MYLAKGCNMPAVYLTNASKCGEECSDYDDRIQTIMNDIEALEGAIGSSDSLMLDGPWDQDTYIHFISAQK